ncbi:hypothetical protein T265_08119 [Opisthorchis viverrini]|uniref:Uncharacterized protein n=1 Tax=Opisthorchis viverrini TaxID=6198 RepID=A0A074ZEN8_OPIVI|nr:hypothetical protein T265_08119 [Opisthorchis viverrini]KER24132.1 hypothetical protein T265_08119 [Opisthorchis viverrini]
MCPALEAVLVRTCATYAEPSFAEESAVFHAQFRVARYNIWLPTDVSGVLISFYPDRLTRSNVGGAVRRNFAPIPLVVRCCYGQEAHPACIRPEEDRATCRSNIKASSDWPKVWTQKPIVIQYPPDAGCHWRIEVSEFSYILYTTHCTYGLAQFWAFNTRRASFVLSLTKTPAYNSVSQFVMHLIPVKCNALFQDWLGSNPTLLLVGELTEITDKSVYPGRYISPSGPTEDSIITGSPIRIVFGGHNLPTIDESIIRCFGHTSVGRLHRRALCTMIWQRSMGVITNRHGCAEVNTISVNGDWTHHPLITWSIWSPWKQAEPRTFRSANYPSYHLVHLVPMETGFIQKTNTYRNDEWAEANPKSADSDSSSIGFGRQREVVQP